MRISKRSLFSAALAAAASTLLFVSCGSLFGSSDDDDGGDEDFTYATATAKVDYTNVNNSVFFDFSTGTIVSEVAHDVWDIAISPADASIISNGGDWGFGVKVLKTASTAIADDLTDTAITDNGDGTTTKNVKELTFKDGTELYGYQSSVNCFEGEIDENGAGSGAVYLILDEAGTYYKVTFDSFGPMGQYSLSVVSGLDGTTVQTISGYLSSAYDYIYFDLGTASKVDYAPAKANWDIRFTRTQELLTATYLTGRSDVLVNAEGGVEGTVVADTAIDAVSAAGGLTFSADVDALGYGWYTHTAGATPPYTVNTLTYVVKTTEGNYGKLQPGTFYGPSSEQFYMTFRYYYQDDGSTTFSH